MPSYLDLFRAPGVLRVVASQLVARFPAGMLSLAVLIHVEAMHASYAAAGLVLAALAVGQGIAGPLTSRVLGRYGLRPVITATLAVCGLATAALALPGLPVGAYAAVAFLAGLSTPPIQPAARAIYPTLVAPGRRTALFSFDASVQEIIWIVGPVLATSVSLTVSTSLGILVAAAFLTGGGLWFLSTPQVGGAVLPPSTGRFGAVLRSPALRLSGAVGFLAVGSTAVVETAVVAVFGEGGPQAGLVLAVFCIGSLLAGLALGAVPMGRWSLARRMGVVALGLAMSVASTGFWWLSLSVFVAGLGVAPVIATLTTITSDGVGAQDAAEAFGWTTTAQLVGVAAGAAAAGALIDASGPRAALALAALAAIAGCGVAAAARRGHPVPHAPGQPAPAEPALP